MPWVVHGRAPIFRLWRSSSQSPASIAIDTIPYPSSQPDPSIFELPTTDEYTTATPAPVAAPPTSSETLVSLVTSDNWKAAVALRDEMLALHIPISPHPAFERAAEHVLRRARDPASRRDPFSAWFRLVPPASQRWSPLYGIRSVIFRTMPHLELPLVIRFGLLCASKGFFAGATSTQTVAAVFRYARPDAAMAFLAQYEHRVRRFCEENGSEVRESYWMGLFSLAARTQALAGRVGDAINIVEMAAHRDYRISAFTFSLLLEHATDPAHVASITAL
ncbi:hypothetical protein BV22DRAFT_1134558, partial [Leucogyrophana mollusca]